MDLTATFKALAGTLRKPKAAIDEVRRSLEAIDLAAAEQRASDLETKRKLLLATGEDADLDAIDEKIAHANRDVERLYALRDRLQEQLAAMEEEAGRANRIKAHEKAEDAASALMSEMPARYEKAALEIIAIVRDIARVEHLINGVNANLPEAFARLESVEQRMRGLPAEPEQVLSTKDLPPEWHYAGDLHGWGAVEPHFLDKIQKKADGKTGRLDRTSASWSRTVDVELRHFAKSEVREVRGRAQPISLAASITLPGWNIGAPNLWERTGNAGGMWGELGAGVELVLHCAEERTRHLRHPPVDPRPEPSVNTRLQRRDKSDEGATSDE